MSPTLMFVLLLCGVAAESIRETETMDPTSMLEYESSGSFPDEVFDDDEIDEDDDYAIDEDDEDYSGSGTDKFDIDDNDEDEEEEETVSSVCFVKSSHLVQVIPMSFVYRESLPRLFPQSLFTFHSLYFLFIKQATLGNQIPELDFDQTKTGRKIETNEIDNEIWSPTKPKILEPSNEISMASTGSEGFFQRTEVIVAIVAGTLVGLVVAISFIVFLVIRRNQNGDLVKKPIYKKTSTMEV
ncbi:hypothetical protein XELAEV_18046006mg [Xenopus laevis]|uniref:Syndecan/Neurexin domain-containing protein n=1 Tax=Xenopus laevis TaxID=8355 RepID=A0A974H083_XENLA|nr:hypothetical protein XELAEV_18046006mg [Xenopus laevis]